MFNWLHVLQAWSTLSLQCRCRLCRISKTHAFCKITHVFLLKCWLSSMCQQKTCAHVSNVQQSSNVTMGKAICRYGGPFYVEQIMPQSWWWLVRLSHWDTMQEISWWMKWPFVQGHYHIHSLIGVGNQQVSYQDIHILMYKAEVSIMQFLMNPWFKYSTAKNDT